MNDDLRSLAERQLRELDSRTRIVVIHPNYNDQRAILLHFLQESGAVYVRLSGKNIDLDTLRQQVEHEIQSQLSAPTKLAMLVLDECDRAAPSALSKFAAEAVQNSKIRLALFGRDLQREFSNQQSLNNVTTFIPSMPGTMLWDYAQKQSANTLLEVRSLGAGHAVLNGRVVREWDGVLPRTLFFFMVDRGLATRTDIFDTFWPQLSTREATNVFHVTKRKVNEILNTDFTVYWSGFYRISSDIQLVYDTVIFTQLCQSGEIAEPEDAERILSQAVAMYRGHFLTTIDVPWVVERRGELKQTYSDALCNLAHLKEQKGDIKSALGLYLRALTTIPYREDIAVQVMRLYDQIQLPEFAVRTFERLTLAMQQLEMGKPATGTMQLLEHIRTRVYNTIK